MPAEGKAVHKMTLKQKNYFANPASRDGQKANTTWLVVTWMAGEVKQDDKLALEWFTKAAAQGYSDSQYHVAHFFLSGRGVNKDEAEALKWLAKAAEQGHANAQ